MRVTMPSLFQGRWEGIVSAGAKSSLTSPPELAPCNPHIWTIPGWRRKFTTVQSLPVLLIKWNSQLSLQEAAYGSPAGSAPDIALMLCQTVALSRCQLAQSLNWSSCLMLDYFSSDFSILLIIAALWDDEHPVLRTFSLLSHTVRWRCWTQFLLWLPALQTMPCHSAPLWSHLLGLLWSPAPSPSPPALQVFFPTFHTAPLPFLLQAASWKPHCGMRKDQ